MVKITAALLAFSALCLTHAAEGFHSFCYFTSWSKYRKKEGKFEPEDIDMKYCSHIMCAFAQPTATSIKPDKVLEEDYRRIVAHRDATRPSTKIILSIGGWAQGSKTFPEIVKSPASRKKFITNLLDYMKKHKFDGLDVMWDYPTFYGSPMIDRDNYVMFLKQIKRAFQATDNQTLVATLPGLKRFIDQGVWVAEIPQYVDFVAIKSYDFHDQSEPRTGHHTAMAPDPSETGVEATKNFFWVKDYYDRLGVPKNKLITGYSSFGRSFKLLNNNHFAISAPATKHPYTSPYTEAKGFASYYELCHFKTNPSMKEYFDEYRRVPYWVQREYWIGMDDPLSIREKACLAAKGRLAGFMFFALDLDDFTGEFCDQGKYPLLKAVFAEFTATKTGSCHRRNV